MTIAARLVQKTSRTLTVEQVFGHDMGWDTGNTNAGVRVTTESAMRLAVHWRCINMLAGDISTLPIDVVESQGNQRIPATPPPWLVRPTDNPNDTRDQHFADVVTSLLVDGNSFTHCLPSVAEAEYVYVLDPAKVTIRSDSLGTGYFYNNTRLGWEQIIHIPLFRLPGKRRGLNPIEASREGIGMGLASQEFGNRFFSNGAAMSGVIQSPNLMAKEAVDTLREQFSRKQQGLRKSHVFGVLTGGATWQQITSSAKDAMLVELWEWIVEDTARFYGIPPFKVGSTKPGAVAYASTSNARIEYVQGGVLPLTRKIESGYKRLLRPMQGLRIDLNGLLRGDQAARFGAYATGLQNKFITKDEVRAWEDLGPADDAPGIDSVNGGYLESPNNNAPGAAPAQSESTDG